MGGFASGDDVRADGEAGSKSAATVDPHEFAADVARVHAWFALHFCEVYERDYERELHQDYDTVGLLVDKYGVASARPFVSRAFAEDLIVRAGIPNPLVVFGWAETLTAPMRDGTRLTEAWSAWLRKRIARDGDWLAKAGAA